MPYKSVLSPGSVSLNFSTGYNLPHSILGVRTAGEGEERSLLQLNERNKMFEILARNMTKLQEEGVQVRTDAAVEFPLDV